MTGNKNTTTSNSPSHISDKNKLESLKNELNTYKVLVESNKQQIESIIKVSNEEKEKMV